MLKPKLVIFDLDGTLLDTIADLGTGVNHSLKEHNMPTFALSEYKAKVGHGMRNLVISSLPEGTAPEVVDSVLKDFLDYYFEHIDVNTLPYPGIPELLRSLRDNGVKLAVASNKIQAGTETLIRSFFPDISFVAILGNSPAYPLKPDAGVVNFILDKAGVAREDAVMVGDSATDIRTGRNAGISTVAVSWGFRPKADLKEADAVVDSVRELNNLWGLD